VSLLTPTRLLDEEQAPDSSDETIELGEHRLSGSVLAECCSPEERPRRDGEPAVRTRLVWNANSHADRHGQDCPFAPAMQHSSGADLTVALHR
jgi:hypothetical protein